MRAALPSWQLGALALGYNPADGAPVYRGPVDAEGVHLPGPDWDAFVRDLDAYIAYKAAENKRQMDAQITAGGTPIQTREERDAILNAMVADGRITPGTVDMATGTNAVAFGPGLPTVAEWREAAAKLEARGMPPAEVKKAVAEAVKEVNDYAATPEYAHVAAMVSAANAAPAAPLPVLYAPAPAASLPLPLVLAGVGVLLLLARGR